MELVVLFGPPAVGKMTVGRELCTLTGNRLFHNHAVIEPLLAVFDFGTEPFRRLTGQFRQRVLEEAIAADLPGLIMTLAWPLELARESAAVAEQLGPALRTGVPLRWVELAAPLGVRQERNNTAGRLDAKPSKRDRAFNDANLLELERLQMNTGGEVCDGARALLDAHPRLRIDNADLPATEAAARIAAWLRTL